MQKVQIYVQLLDEGTPTMRPTEAIVLENGLFKVLPIPDYDPEDEIWEYLPGSIVKCQEFKNEDGQYLLAVDEANL